MGFKGHRRRKGREEEGLYLFGLLARAMRSARYPRSCVQLRGEHGENGKLGSRLRVTQVAEFARD